MAADSPFDERIDPGVVFRVGRKPEPFDWPEWVYAPFGNRYDDPEGVYRVLYTCSQRQGAFVETLSRFRPDAEVYEELALIEGDEPFVAQGVVPTDWISDRMVGRAMLVGPFANVGGSHSLAFLHQQLAQTLDGYGIPGLTELDAGAIRLLAPTPLTKRISRMVFEFPVTPPYAGLGYRSRLGDEFENWAIFERATPPLPAFTVLSRAEILENDPDLIAGLELLGLALG